MDDCPRLRVRYTDARLGAVAARRVRTPIAGVRETRRTPHTPVPALAFVDRRDGRSPMAARRLTWWQWIVPSPRVAIVGGVLVVLWMILIGPTTTWAAIEHLGRAAAAVIRTLMTSRAARHTARRATPPRRQVQRLRHRRCIAPPRGAIARSRVQSLRAVRSRDGRARRVARRAGRSRRGHHAARDARRRRGARRGRRRRAPRLDRARARRTGWRARERADSRRGLGAGTRERHTRDTSARDVHTRKPTSARADPRVGSGRKQGSRRRSRTRSRRRSPHGCRRQRIAPRSSTRRSRARTRRWRAPGRCAALRSAISRAT